MHTFVGYAAFIVVAAIIWLVASRLIVTAQCEAYAKEIATRPFGSAQCSQLVAIQYGSGEMVMYGPFNTIREFEDWFDETGHRIGFRGTLTHIMNPWMDSNMTAWFFDPSQTINERFGRDVVSGSEMDPESGRKARYCADCNKYLTYDYDPDEDMCPRCLAWNSEYGYMNNDELDDATAALFPSDMTDEEERAVVEMANSGLSWEEILAVAMRQRETEDWY